MSLIIVANRAPFRITAEGLVPAVGGLATALLPVLEARGGTWVAAAEWGERGRTAQPRQTGIRLERVFLSDREWQGYYGGFSNRILWPLCHYFLEKVELKREYFQDYLRVNRRFAEVVARIHREGDTVFVQDYHLLLLPGLLREKIQGPLGFFFHIPWPSSGVFRILPWGRALVEGVLGADLVGFHTQEYVENFLRTAAYYGFAVEENRVRVGERLVRVEAHPMGIDTHRFHHFSESPEVGAHARSLRRLAGVDRLILGVDRLDYTKGIRERLLAYERFLQAYPHWRGRVAFFQIATPSRTQVAAYRELKRQVDEVVGRILGAFLREDWVPLRYFYQTYTQEELAAFYRAADVALISPLRDGMNLVAMEYAYTASEGVLVLSNLAGAGEYLKEALLVNPYDLDGMAAALDRALRMPPGERQERLLALKARVEALNAQTWAERFLASLEAG